MQPNKLILITVLFSLILLKSGLTLACKDRFYPETFPLQELKEYEHVYVVRVEKINPSKPLEASWYAPPFSLEGEIIKTLKGSLKPHEIITASTSSNEEAHARCPIILQAGKIYLLMFLGNKPPYTLPRYGSLFTSSE
jgi:hypothetical protein